MLPWNDIHTVLLDMDGTLLDLNFDTHFWLEHIPLRYAEARGIDVSRAKEVLFPRMKEMEGTMDWYCLDFWSRELELDVVALKQEVDHLIAVHPHVSDFLEAVRATRRQVLLVTNAHMRSLSLKMERTRLAGHFDAVVCAHDFGVPKEQPAFWGRLRAEHPFEPCSTLLVDDSRAVLRCARNYGIAHLLGVHRPDSRSAPVESTEFELVRSFRDLIPQGPAGGD